MAAVDVGSWCTCNNSFDGVRRTCVACGRLAGSGITDGDVDGLDETGASVLLPRLIAGFISGALTAVFAIAGAFTGAVTGALAGRASDSGILRRAGLGAVAGAVLSIEVLEASRAYWCSERTTDASISMADFIEELLHARIVQEHFNPTISRFQVNIPVLEIGDENMYDIFGDMSWKGLSDESLKKLPRHEITKERLGIHEEDLSCTVCLQDFVTGETVRSLPLCSHTFHLTCIDKWLVANGSCPVCRQYV
ncbi:NEP1-interacting protein-like 2 [Carex rostrata]